MALAVRSNMPGSQPDSGPKSRLTLELFTSNDDARPVFVAGNFNGWTVRDARYQMEKVKDGHYRLVFQDFLTQSEPLEYKYTKGGWEAEELDQDGNPPSNRRIEMPSGKVMDVAHKWKYHNGSYDPRFYPDIRVIAKRFNMPQLRRRRRISVLLPWNYAATEQRYPVLYLQDGQNLFEDDAPFGTWGLDKQLAILAQNGHGNFIVVAIDHGGKERIREFSPYDSQRWGEGLGRDYARFLSETLKPYIDKNFRTLPDRANTAIGGSSMGGLISAYAGIAHPEIYSKYMIFSPSLWAASSLFREPLHTLRHSSETKVYLYGGSYEGANMVSNMERFKEMMERQGGVNFRLEIDPKGKHNEDRWGQEFPKAVMWLFPSL
jgi:predicted alpha/beta superfamily hydrolase